MAKVRAAEGQCGKPPGGLRPGVQRAKRMSPLFEDLYSWQDGSKKVTYLLAGKRGASFPRQDVTTQT